MSLIHRLMSRLWHRIRRRRTIQIAPGGQWFLALTIAFGVTAVLSGNSVLYLLESLLLGLLILSGVLSDRMLWNLSARWQELPTHAGGPLADRIIVANRSRLPALAVELGEWGPAGFELRGYLPVIRPRSEVEVPPSGDPYPERGRREWSGRVIATRFPFGFARKIRWISPVGERWVRPRIRDAGSDAEKDSARLLAGGAAGLAEFEDGVLRPFTPGDDPRDIAWVYSARLLGPHVQRVRSSTPECVQLKLESAGLDREALERHLSLLATRIVQAARTGAPLEFEFAPGKWITETEAALELLARHPGSKGRSS
jgi:uncharacterized protein (DUF58 family)